MEIVGLIIWGLVVLLALPLAAAGSLTSPSLGLQSLLSIAGLVFCILFMATSGGRWLAWTSAGLAIAAALAVGLGAAALVSDAPRTSSAGQDAEEGAAMLAGIAWPLLIMTGFAMGLAAAGITTVD